MDKGELERICGRATLSMFDSGTIFVFSEYTIVDMSSGEAVQVSYETIDGTSAKSGRLLLPSRFIDECAKMVPCVAIYKGMALSRATKRYHDLRFIPSMKSVITDSCSPEKQKKSETIKKRVKCLEFHCVETNDRCPGYCIECGDHMHPYSQCKCVLRQRDFCGICEVWSCGLHCPACGTHGCLCHEQPSPYETEEIVSVDTSPPLLDAPASQDTVC